MENEKFQKIALIVLSFLQIAVSVLCLNSLSRIENWSAVYAEDSTGYLLVADYFSGSDIAPENIPVMRYRLFSPAIPCVASLLGKIVGIPAAFLMVNILLWIATVLIFYELLKILLRDNFSAFIGGAVLTTSLPFIEWGLPIMVDMGSYFFAALIPLLYLKFFHLHPSRERKHDNPPSPGSRRLKVGVYIYKSIILSVCIGLAILTKPLLVILLLFALLFFLSEKRYGSALITFFIPVVLVAGVYSLFNLSVKDFASFGTPRHRGAVYLVSAACFCFHWGWIYFAKGWKAVSENRKFYLLYLVSFILPYLFFVHNPRLFFLSYPAVIPLIAQGLKKQCEHVRNQYRTGLVLLGGYIITSNLLTIFHLYVMRCLKIRGWGGVVGFFSQFFYL